MLSGCQRLHNMPVANSLRKVVIAASYARRSESAALLSHGIRCVRRHSPHSPSSSLRANFFARSRAIPLIIFISKGACPSTVRPAMGRCNTCPAHTTTPRKQTDAELGKCLQINVASCNGQSGAAVPSTHGGNGEGDYTCKGSIVLARLSSPPQQAAPLHSRPRVRLALESELCQRLCFTCARVTLAARLRSTVDIPPSGACTVSLHLGERDAFATKS